MRYLLIALCVAVSFAFSRPYVGARESINRARRALAAVVVGAWAALGPCSVAAEPYAALGFGHTTLRAATTGKQSDAALTTISAGYRFGRVFGVEASYLTSSGGDHDADLAAGTVRSTSSDWETDGIGAFATAAVPVGHVSIIARAGAYRLDGRVTSTEIVTTAANGVTQTQTFVKTDAWNGWTPAYSLGVAYAFTPKVSVRALGEHIDGRDGLARGRTLSIGLAYTF